MNNKGCPLCSPRTILTRDKLEKHFRNEHTGQYPYNCGLKLLDENDYSEDCEYKTGNYVSGYSHIMNNLLMYRYWNLGSIEETLNGEIFSPAGVCSQQGWSESMVLQPIIEGMLGISPDALCNQISLSPRFPWHWKEVKVDNIIFGNHKVNFKMLRTATSTTFQFQEVLENGSIMRLSPSLPPSTIIKKVLVNGESVKYTVLDNAESVNLVIDGLVINGQTIVKIIHF